MNYSRNLRKAAMAKRILISWLIAVLAGGLIGFALGHITGRNGTKTEEQTSEQVENKTLVYGAYDDRTFTEEISLDWGAGDLDFKPLDVKMDDDLQEFIYYISTGYNLDFTLIMAVIQHESSFNSSVISRTNDYGLMQINKINHEYITETLGITDFTDPYQNVRGGVFILRKLFERYEDTDMVLMAYNMGEDGAKRLWDQEIYETNYTTSILNIQQQFNEQLGR